MRHYRTMTQAARDARAEAMCAADVPVRDGQDQRQPIALDLRPGGGRSYVLEPRLGYVAWRVLDANTREVLKCCALKEALHWIADQTPRQLGARNFM